MSILRLCENTPIVEYYKSLLPDSRKNNIDERERRVIESDAPMLQYYRSILNPRKKSSIYSSFLDDQKRQTITRWRLSNHKLQIETGRYRVPRVERADRKCHECNVVEDEHHAIFICPAFNFIRTAHQRLLEKYQSVNTFLDPDLMDTYEVADFLGEIDKVLEKR